MTAAFHINNQEAKHELKVYNNNRLLPFRPTPTYLGLKLDRLLTFYHYLVALCKKLSLLVTCCDDLQAQDGVLVPKHYVQLPYLWSTQQLSTVHQSGVTVFTLVS